MTEHTPQAALPGMEDEFEVPAPIQSAAEDYRDALTAKGKATQAFNASREQLIEAMKEAGISRVRVQVKDGFKIVTLDQKDEIKMKKDEPKKDDALAQPE